MDTDAERHDDHADIADTDAAGTPGIAPGVTQGGSPDLPGSTEYSIHDQDAGELEEPRSVERTAEELAADDRQQAVAPGSSAHERGAGTRSPSGGDDAVAGDSL